MRITTPSLFSSMNSPLSIARVYDEIYARRLKTPLLGAIDAATSGNQSLSKKGCSTILSESSLRRLRKAISTSDSACFRILDVGCGLGGLARWFVEQRNCSVVAIDASKNAVTQALVRNHHSNIQFIAADFERIGDQIGYFDLAVSLDALYLVGTPLKWLMQMNAVLRPGAMLMFTFYTSSNGIAGTKHNKGEWESWLAQAAFKVVALHNVTRFWRDQMKRRHHTRLAQSNRILSSDGHFAIPDLRVSRTLFQGCKSGTSWLRSVSRYEVYACRALCRGETDKWAG